MRRAFVSDDHAAGHVGFALCLAFDQRLDLPAQKRKLFVLARNNIRKLIGQMLKMSDPFFQLFQKGASA